MKSTRSLQSLLRSGIPGLSLSLFLILNWNAAIAQKNKIQCTAPTVSMSADVTICNGSSVTVQATGSGTSSPYTYDWSPVASVACPTCSNTSVNPTTTTTYTCLVTDGVTCTNTGTVTVTVNPTPTVSISGSGSVCAGFNATLTASGGNTYSWNTGSTATTIVAAPSAAANYTVWGTNSFGCASTATASIGYYTSPTASISGNLTICNGSSTTLTGSGGVSYQWLPGGSTATSVTVNPTTGTTYTLIATDANSCTDTDQSAVTVNNLPGIGIGGAGSICATSTATLTASGGDTYVWSPGGSTTTSIQVTPTGATTYTLAGTNTVTGCANTATATVSLHALPTASITGTTTICIGQATTLTASGGTQYSWSTGATTTTIVDLPTNTTFYTVQATDANGCTDLANQSVVVVPLPVANAGSDVSICAGSNTTLNASGNGTSYVWTPGIALSNTTIVNPVANPTSTITYTITSTNFCGSADDSVKVTINPSPSVNAGTDQTICLGGQTTLLTSGSGTYAWLPGGGLSCSNCPNPVANPTVSVNYTVTITDICGTASDSVWVIIDQPTVAVTGNSPVCSGQSSTLTAVGSGNYSWNTGATTSSIVVTPTGSTGYTVTLTDGIGCTATDQFMVTVNPLPNASINGSTTVCAGTSDTLVASGGVTYVWNTGVTNDTLIVSPTSASSYTVTVYDAIGCSNTSSISIAILPQPTAAAGSDFTICAGSSVTLGGTGNGSYLWSPSTGLSNPNLSNPVASPTGSTNYTLTVSNVCGTATDVAIVTVNGLPAAAITGQDTVCSGMSDTLLASGGGTYLWNTGSTASSVIVNPTAGTGYTVTVTDGNGCTNAATFSVSVSSVSASISGNSTICSGDNSTLTASGGNSYVWNTGSTASSIVVTPSATAGYTLVASNLFGCTDTVSINITVINQPTANVTATTASVCIGSAATLTASGGTSYSWIPSTSLSNVNIANPIATPTSPITYTVIVSVGSCADTATISLGVNPVPTASVNATSASICLGGCASLSASGGITYLWMPGSQTGSSINPCPTIATTYTVTATDANGCTDNASTVINVLPPINLLLSGDTTICANSATLLTAQGGSSYSWNTGQTTSSISVMPSASASYTVISTNGACFDTATINVTAYPLPAALATASSYSINIGGNTTLTGATSTGTYNWTPTTGLSCGACANPVANPTVTTIYTLFTTDANGCTASDTVIVYVGGECGEVFLPTAFSPNSDGVNEEFRIRNLCLNEVTFIIYNRWGQKVFVTEDPLIGWDGKINGKEADPAVFFYVLSYDLITQPGTFYTKQGNVTLVR